MGRPRAKEGPNARPKGRVHASNLRASSLIDCVQMKVTVLCEFSSRGLGTKDVPGHSEELGTHYVLAASVSLILIWKEYKLSNVFMAVFYIFAPKLQEPKF